MTPRPEWLEACAARIRELLPQTGEADALEMAAAMWEDRHCDDDPRACAEHLLLGDASAA